MFSIRNVGISMIKMLSLGTGLALTLSALTASAAGGAGSVAAVTLADVPAQTQSEKPAPTASEAVPGPIRGLVPEAASNYAFATTATGSLADMSSGTTTLLLPNVDDTSSPVTDIGFDFFFQGVRYSQFAINENGVLRLGALSQTGSPYQPLAQANIPLITAYGADQRTHTGDGRVHYRLTGTAPSRTLTVEWLNNQANFNTGGTADLTYQVQLNEGTGAIRFVYGRMNMSTAGATSIDSQDPHIGFSSTNTAGNIGSVSAPVSGTPAPSYDGVAAAPLTNLYNTAGPITVLTSAADGARRTFSFTPPIPTAPTGLSFSAVVSNSITLNWTDSADEQAYAVYNSTDGINYTYAGAAAQNATSVTMAGLTPATNYSWRLYAISEGALSASFLAGAQATPAAPVVASVAAGGNWSNPATWAGGVVPANTDAVVIVAGTPVVIDTAAVAQSVTIDAGATLNWDATTARTLVVGSSVTNNGIFQSGATGTVTNHVLTVGTDLTNNNTLDFSTNTNTAAATITFTGATNATFGGSGATTDVRAITVNKGTSPAAVLDLAPANFSVQGLTTDSAGFLTLTNGTFKISGSFTATNRIFTVANYVVGASAGLWLNNANFTVAAQSSSPTVNGRLRVSNGTYNVGTALGNSVGFGTQSNIVVEGGTVNVASRFGVAAASTAFSYTQSGGTITVCTVGNTSTTLSCFDLGTHTGAFVAISGGTIVSQLASTAASGPRDYRFQGGIGGSAITGGTLQLGNASSGTAKTFNIAGATPNIVVTSTSGNHTGNFLAPAGINNISRNITTQTGATLNTGNQVFLFNGDSIVNNGTLTSTGTAARFITFRPATPIGYSGTGTVTAPMNSLELQNDLAFTFDPAVSNVVTNRVIIFSGSFVNANKITLGSGAASTGIVQIGNTTTPTGGGTFDVAPTFNLGTGGQNISYLRTTNSKTVGPEVNPTRVLNNLSYDDNDPAHTLTVAGGDVTVNATLTLTTGPVVASAANRVIIGASGVVARTNGYVDGYLAKTFTAIGSKTYEVGTSTGYSPAIVDATAAAAFPAVVEAAAFNGKLPNFTPTAKTIDRHWRVLAPAGTTANLTFNYLDGDLPGTVTEADLHVYNGVPNPPTSYTDIGGTVTAGTNTATASALSQFEYFGLAEAGGGGSADLTLSKTDSVTTVDTGASLTYNIVVSNVGGTAVSNANVIETPGTDLTCGAWNCTASAGSSCGTASGTGAINDLPSLLAGGNVSYSQSCTVATVSTQSNITNAAVVTLPSGQVDVTPSNNTATDVDDLVRLSDVSVAKTNGSTSVNNGSTTIYTITVSNAGPNAAMTTTTDTFPSGLTGCNWTCAATGGSCAAGGAGSFADSGSLSSGGTLVYTATCTVSATGSVSNTASVAVGTGERDTNPSNNSATDTDTVIQLPDVAVTITDNRQYVRVGESLSYVIRVTNPAGSATATVAVSDPLPSELSGGSWTCVGTGGATCASGTGNTLSDNAVVPGGGEAAYVYSATVQPASSDGIISNTVTVTAAGDPNTANNTASDTPEDTIVLFKNGFETAPITLVPEGAGNANGYVAGLLRVDPNLLATLELMPLTVAVGYSDSGTELFALELSRFNQQIVLRSVLRDANGLAERTAWIPVELSRNGIEFAWQAASADASDGYLRLAGGGASQTSGGRSAQGKLATLAVTQQQGLAWLSLVVAPK